MFCYSNRIILNWGSWRAQTGISHNINAANTAKGLELGTGKLETEASIFLNGHIIYIFTSLARPIDIVLFPFSLFSPCKIVSSI